MKPFSPAQRPNVDAAARDHLANERTFLAWLRTGFAVTGVGIALPKLADVGGARAVICAVLVMTYGSGLILYGVIRHHQSDLALLEGRASIDTRGPALIAALAIVLTITCALLLS